MPRRVHRLIPAIAAVSLALAIGSVGGWIFSLLALPLAWMLGAMCLVTAGAVAGLPVQVPKELRAVMIAILGIMLGSVFTPEVFARAGQWLGGILLLALYVATATGVVLAYFRRAAGYDPVTAYFSATPGGFNEMVLTGEAMGGDVRTISLSHAVRVLVVVIVVPFYFRLVEGYDVPSAPMAAGDPGALGLGDVLLLAACGIAGYPLARRLRLPAAALVGPMALSAAAHLSGLTTAGPPAWLIAVAQVVVGTAVGCRFAGVKLAEVRRRLGVAVGATALLLIVALVFAWAAGHAGIAPPTALFLAFAPGGLAEMSLVALALGIDTVFVSTMHIFRIVYVVIGAPVFFRTALRKRRD